ncbi:hypothetical protein A3E39_00115 [Candidatus Uhrbacteria bacterium RIFCSPHIGHO2_12_FULL_60_25]|uniref:Uncharacterized protein n=1 Tax=Candidatus Uhrbacteria bacterium RIFCSPHIGHO2_12_FULL_60_25 TaxID=1802399 RepID=A0A1F7UMI9_9BACT|nr:MAG: hypothetical protein A3E39_00115 [Candidatus Uhrbacteria bacterium RIFCSPHIGHO2_12_FULL_60_25]
MIIGITGCGGAARGTPPTTVTHVNSEAEPLPDSEVPESSRCGTEVIDWRLADNAYQFHEYSSIEEPRIILVLQDERLASQLKEWWSSRGVPPGWRFVLWTITQRRTDRPVPVEFYYLQQMQKRLHTSGLPDPEVPYCLVFKDMYVTDIRRSEQSAASMYSCTFELYRWLLNEPCITPLE